MRYDAERDLRILEAMADQMEPYLIEDELFWPISGPVRGGMPRMTLGGYLLRQHRLTALRGGLTAHQQERLQEALAAFTAARAEWGMHYNNKLTREWGMRVHLLHEFLRDCNEADVRHCADYWPVQAKQRTILHHLREEAAERDILSREQEAELARIDRELRRYLLPGEQGAFLWAEGLEPVYPRETYWWLWVAPPAEEEEAD